jgi:hypothetical protein
MIRVVIPWNSLLMGLVGPGPPGLSICILDLLARLFFNPHTAHSDVGGTSAYILEKRLYFEKAPIFYVYASANILIIFA